MKDFKITQAGKGNLTEGKATDFIFNACRKISDCTSITGGKNVDMGAGWTVTFYTMGNNVFNVQLCNYGAMMAVAQVDEFDF